MNTRRAQIGFTLIELLLYVAITGTLLVSVSMFFGMVTESRVKSQSVSEVDQQGEAAITLITQVVRNGTTVTAPATGATGSSLTVTVPTGALSPTIFDVSSGVLRIKEGSGAVVSLTNSKVTVTNLTVKNLTRSGTAGIVQVSLTLSRINTINRNEYDYTKTFTTSVAIR